MPKVDGGREVIWADEQSLLQSVDDMLAVPTGKCNVVKRKLQKTSMN